MLDIILANIDMTAVVTLVVMAALLLFLIYGKGKISPKTYAVIANLLGLISMTSKNQKIKQVTDIAIKVQYIMQTAEQVEPDKQHDFLVQSTKVLAKSVGIVPTNTQLTQIADALALILNNNKENVQNRTSVFEAINAITDGLGMETDKTITKNVAAVITNKK